MKKSLIILALLVTTAATQVFAVPMDKTHPSLTRPQDPIFPPISERPMDKTHPSLLPPAGKPPVVNPNTRPPMDKTHPSLVKPNGKPLPPKPPIINPNTRPPMDKTHPSLVKPGYDWTHDSWYGNDDYYKKNWGYSKASFRNWLDRHPHISKRDRKALEKLYKEQIKFEKTLQKSLSKYRKEIGSLPAYRKYKNPTDMFISDFMNRREILHGYRLSPGLRNELNRQERANASYFRLIDGMRI